MLCFLAIFCDHASLLVVTARRKDWHSAATGAVLSADLGAKGASEILPCRLDRRCGASVVRRDAVMNRIEDLNVKICQEAITCKIIACKNTIVGEGGKALPTVCREVQNPQGRYSLEA